MLYLIDLDATIHTCILLYSGKYTSAPLSFGKKHLATNTLKSVNSLQKLFCSVNVVQPFISL